MTACAQCHKHWTVKRFDTCLNANLDMPLCLNDKRVHFEGAFVFSIVSWWAGWVQSANIICGWPIWKTVHNRCVAPVQECLAHSWMQFFESFSNRLFPLVTSFAVLLKAQKFWFWWCVEFHLHCWRLDINVRATTLRSLFTRTCSCVFDFTTRLASEQCLRMLNQRPASSTGVWKSA